MLSSKFDKGEAKGAVIIGVTNESIELVDDWVAKRKPTYPIVILANQDLENAMDVQGFPTQGVISPEGILTYAGYSAEGAFKSASKKATKGSLYPKSLAKVHKAMRSGDRAKAYGGIVVMETEGKVDPADAEWVANYKKWIEDMVATDLNFAREEFKSGLVYNAFELAEPIASSKAAFPVTADAKAFISDLEALPDFNNEMKAGKLFAKAAALRSQEEYADAAKKFASIGRKYDGLLTGKAAMQAARRLVDEGKPGYKSVCDHCRKGKRACSKHAVKIKL